MGYYVGIDLGATNVRAVVGSDDDPTADLADAVVGRARRPTPTGPDGDAVTAAVCAVAREACADAGIVPESVTAAGVGSIGPLDLDAGAVVAPANLPPAVETIPLREPLCGLLDTDDVSLLNDTVAGVVGERAGRPGHPDNIVYLTISTGIGAGACVDGRVLTGADGNAGEVGHATVDPTGAMACNCGALGHWEAYCSGENIPQYARSLYEDGVETSLPVDDPGLSSATVFAHAADDAFATEVIEQVGEWNAIGVANLAHAFAPSVVAVGGAVALNNPEAVLAPIRERLPERSCVPVPDVELTAFGEDVVVHGALAWAMPETLGTAERTPVGHA